MFRDDDLISYDFGKIMIPKYPEGIDPEGERRLKEAVENEKKKKIRCGACKRPLLVPCPYDDKAPRCALCWGRKDWRDVMDRKWSEGYER